ncbi:MAG: hypothetical protein DLM62_16810 [Pseudonocardiales bacterium]|nr:MAG: hypothetical protein DLM62_16810 [Pseudonocardiales bacterium]
MAALPAPALSDDPTCCSPSASRVLCSGGISGRTVRTLPGAPVMSFFRVLLTDRTGLLGAGSGLLAGLPPAAVYCYLLLRLLIPVLLIILASRRATPGQKIGLVRDYLIGTTPSPTRSRKRR